MSRCLKQRFFNGRGRKVSTRVPAYAICYKPDSGLFAPTDSVLIELVAITRVGGGGKFNQAVESLSSAGIKPPSITQCLSSATYVGLCLPCEAPGAPNEPSQATG